MSRSPFRGVLVPVLTPFQHDLNPDSEAFLGHCRWLLGQGADGLAVFGTTSEANSLSVEERMELLDVLIDGGIPGSRLMPGTGTCALTDTVRLTAHAVARGCAGVLMLPPFYYKPVSDEGLFAAYSEVIERVGDARLCVYLYHIPPVAHVGLSFELIERLLTAYPQTVIGLKDSSGDWGHIRDLLHRFPGLATFSGSEAFLLATLREGGAGCITATGNINPAGIRTVFEHREQSRADRLQARVAEIRNTLQGYPLIPALKVIAGRNHDWPGGAIVRPPLVNLTPQAAESLLNDLVRIGFRMDENKASVAG